MQNKSKYNKLLIAAAGAGKTTYLVKQALECSSNVLITTFTQENALEIKKKIVELKGCIPSNIIVQTWFTFLLKHGVKPYQGCVNEQMCNYAIKGLYLVNTRSGCIDVSKHIYYAEDTAFFRFYFNERQKIFSDKIAKFVCRANEKSNGSVVDRISTIYPNIFIDEVQDLVGYDLEIIKYLFLSSVNILLVGDPRQVTYYTHWEQKYRKYQNGKINLFIEENCKKLNVIIDDRTLSVSHRNNLNICQYASRLYPQLTTISPCLCPKCHSGKEKHQGIFGVRSGDVKRYLTLYNAVQLRWDRKVRVEPYFETYNFGESKGKTFDRVLIYPTKPMLQWMLDNNSDIICEARAKLYVGITRAKYSVGIVIPDNHIETYKHCINVWGYETC